MKPRQIVIDGKTYNSVNDMPPEVRQQYDQAMRAFRDQDRNRIPDAIDHDPTRDDKNRNGIPDAVENTSIPPVVAGAMKMLFNGREYNSLDELPPDVRAQYDQAMGTLDANRNGIPDFLEGRTGAPSMSAGTTQPEDHASRHSGSHTTHHAPREPMPYTPTIEPDRANGWLLALLGILLFFLCVAVLAGAWYFYFR